MSAELLIALVAPLATAAGVYAALRADLARAIVVAEHAHAAAETANRRIDAMKK